MTDLTPPAERVRAVLVNVQALRFFAAALVVCHHAVSGLLPAGTPSLDAAADRWFPFMSGVDVFFVISGFIMQHTAGDATRGAASAVRFVERRLIRIVPLYWLFTALMLLVIVTLGRHVRHATFSAPWAVASFLFIPWPIPGAGPRPMPATGEIAPVMSLGWTLNYEMLFYALFAMATWLLPRRWRVPVVGAALALLVALPHLMRIDNLQLRFYAHPIVLEFLFGMLLAVALPRVRASVAWLALAVVGVAILANTHGYPGMRSLYLGVPAAMVCAGAMFAPGLPDTRAVRGLRLLGDSSYALYLCHLFVLRALSIALHGQAQAHPVLFFVASLSGSILVSVAVHLWIEKPSTRLLRHAAGRLRSRGRSGPALAGEGSAGA